MATKRGKPVTFRPSVENEKRFEYALSLGIDRAEAVNDILDGHFQKYLVAKRDERARVMKLVLESPIP